LIYACFPLQINKPSSVDIPCEDAGFLDLFRTRENARESLDHFDAYLFLYAFKMESLDSLCHFQKYLFP
jgi:hypothetical protein